MKLYKYIAFALLLGGNMSGIAQQRYELKVGWQCANVDKVKVSGEVISAPTYRLTNWLNASVPGTVLTTLLNNKLVTDPFYGMNNKLIPDVYFTGNNYYTYWFIKDFKETVTPLPKKCIPISHCLQQDWKKNRPHIFWGHKLIYGLNTLRTKKNYSTWSFQELPRLRKFYGRVAKIKTRVILRKEPQPYCSYGKINALT